MGTGKFLSFCMFVLVSEKKTYSSILWFVDVTLENILPATSLGRLWSYITLNFVVFL